MLVDLTLVYLHGVFMWSAWALLASIGIMSSTHRFIFEAKGFWFKIHRTIQTFVVIFTIIGFIIAIVATVQFGSTHFQRDHQIGGLVVMILTIFQPINAFFRPHNPASGEQKETKRKIWEIIHKVLGYTTWIAGCLVAYLGFIAFGQDVLKYVHLYGWCGLLLIINIALSIYGEIQTKQQKQIISTNDDIDKTPTTTH